MSAILLFDGVCNFCNASVNFVMEHDRDGFFKFAPLQSEAGRTLAAEHGISSATVEKKADAIDSLILIEEGHVYTHSTGALRIARRLGAPWSWS